MGGGERRVDSSGSGYGQVVGFCDNGNETSGPIKCRELLDQLSFSCKSLLHGVGWIHRQVGR